jgi:glycosyltransferase involved in cell wall biosynthesis
VPIILDIHDLLPEFYASKFSISHDSFLFRRLVQLERWSARFADHVIVANHIWCERLAARSSSQEKCSVVRNHPDLQIFTPQIKNDKDAQRRFIISYPGSLNWHQGVDVAIRAFAHVAERIPEAEFHIYGEGPAKNALISLAVSLGLQDRVLFHDFLPSSEVAKVMAATDLAVEPKRAASKFGNEAASTKILEFMALGVPVIASRTRVHAYYYNEDIIRYYDNDDENQLADLILQMRNDPQLRREIASRASKYAEHNTWQVCKTGYLDLVDRLTKQKPSPAVPQAAFAARS